MKKNKIILLLSLLFLSIDIWATHAQGADISLKCLGGNQYEVTGTFYRDCGGINAPNSITFEFRSASNCSNNFDVDFTDISVREITPVCPSAITTCNGGAYPGVEEYVYRGTVTLPPCDDWVVGYAINARNNAISTGPSGNIYVEATLDNLNYPCNSTPEFTTPPVPYICVNQPFCFNHGAYDSDGDSIVYSLSTPKTSTTSEVNYTGGYSSAQPLTSNPPMTIDSQTGLVCLTPTQMEVSVLAVLVEEYRGGVLIGSVIRDVQIQVVDCSTNTPPAVSGIDGNANQFSVAACPNTNLCFDVYGSDANATNTVTLSTNLSSLPGATFNVDNTDPNNPVGHFCWNNVPANGTYTFSVMAQDDGCPFNASYTASYTITIEELLVDLGPDISFCGGGNTTLNPTITGGATPYSFDWSPTNDTTPTIDVTNGTFIVDVSDANGCLGSDTIDVVSYPNPVADFTVNDTCLTLPNSFIDNSSISSGSITDWAWDFGDGTGTSSNASPVYTYSSPNTYTVELIVTSDSLCSDTIEVDVDVIDSPIADFTADTVCLGMTTTFSDVSTGGADTWSWDYDNDGGEDSNLQNPSYTFSAAGTHDVTLSVEGVSDCSHDTTITIYVNPTSTASFTADTVCLGVATTFTSTSSAGVDTWNWDFDNDGNVDATNENPSYIFPTAGTHDVNLAVSIGGNCTHDTTITVTVNSTSTASFTADTVCLGVATTFTSTSSAGVDAWNWDFDNDGNVDDTNENPSYTFSTAGTHDVNLAVSIGGNCPHDTTITVIVNPTAIADFTPNTVCLGTATTFTDASTGGADTWGWDFDNDGNIDSTIQSPTYTFSASGTYPVNLEVSIGGNCPHDTTIIVTVNQSSVASFTPDTVCLGIATVFTSTSSAGVDAWNWDFDNDGNVDDTNENPSYTFSTAGTHDVNLEVSIGGNCTHDTTITVTVNPTSTASFTADTVCLGVATTFTSTSSAGVDAWNWDFDNDGNVDDTNENPSYIFPTAGTHDVNLEVSIGGNCPHDTTITVTVNPTSTASFTADTVCLGVATTFIYDSTGGADAWNWDFDNDGNVDAANENPSYTFSTVGTHDVNLEVSIGGNCPHDTIMNVYVEAQPIANFSATNVCFGTTNTFRDLSNPNGGIISSWQWDFDNNSSVDNITQNPTNGYSSAGTYTVELLVSTAFGCADSITKQVVVNPTPVAGFTFVDVCFGEEVNFSDTSTISTGNIDGWAWDFGDSQGTSTSQNPTYTYANADTFSVSLTVTSDSNCINTYVANAVVNEVPVADFTTNNICLNQEADFMDSSNPNGGTIDSWAWDFGGTGTSSDINPSHSYPSADTYDVELIVTTTEGCVDTIIQSIEIYPMPIADFTFTNECYGIPIVFTDSSSVSSGTITNWDWNFGNNNTSMVQNPIENYGADNQYEVELIVTTNNGCRDTLNQQVTVFPLPLVDFTPTSVCLNAITQFRDTTTVSNGSLNSWDWDFGDNQGTSNLQNPTYTYTQEGTYSAVLVVTTNNGCVDSTTKDVVVNPLPVVGFSGEGEGCLSACVDFKNNTTIATGLIETWQWDLGDGNTSLVRDPSHCFQNLSHTSVAVYDVSLTATSDQGCVSEATIPSVATVYPKPLADFSFSPDDGDIYNSEVYFTDQSVIANSWEWNLGDGDTSTLQHPVHEYADSGHYYVSLYVENQYSCRDTVIKLVKIKPAFAVWIPNAFTPDGDGKNDFFFADGYGIEEIHTLIFDRWGLNIYEGYQLYSKWDGTYKGELVVSDVYVYKIKVRDIFGKWHEFIGRVTPIK